jgi:4-diphosphocytidyl-2-C-methyl-D-erythritol kinase
LRVTASLAETAHAKINLTLRVVGRRADGYHELESLVAFADLADLLTLVPADETTLAVAGPFAASCGPIADNLVLKTVAALRDRLGALKAGQYSLHKNIPVAGGLGGGSADAAAALRLLARINDLAPDDPRLVEAALAVGADVPVCLASKPRVMRGIGEQLSEPLELPRLAALLVNPGVALATGDVFASFVGVSSGTLSVEPVPRGRAALFDYLARHDNDLAAAAVARAPVVAEVLETLRALPGAHLAHMSGSGPTCFALFASPQEAASAARRLQAEHKDWWIHAGLLGGSGP